MNVAALAADPGYAALLRALPQWAFGFALVLARVGSACMLLPVLGESETPATIRAGFVVATVALLLPGLLPLLPAAPSQPLRVAGMVATEIVTGLWLGWLARLVLLALPVAGQVTALLVGQSSILQQDPALGTQTAALGRLMSVAAPVLVLASGLYAMPLLALSGSYAVIPAGTPLPGADTLQGVVAAVGAMFALAVRLAAPFLLASLGWQVALALLGRLAPHLQISSLAAPAHLLLGLLLLGVFAAAVLAVWQERAAALLAALPGL